MSKNISILGLFQKLFHNFNARQMKDATLAFKKHLDDGGKMLLAMGGAMSSAQLGVTLAPMIKEDKMHIISCTGANLEESIFRLVAHDSYKDYPDYRYFTKEDDEAILNRGERRVTDTSIPEEEAFRVIEPIILKRWKEAEKNGQRFFPHEYFYQILLSGELKGKYEGNPEHCWLLEAAEKNLTIVVPGGEALGAYLDVARTVARRAERGVVALRDKKEKEVNDLSLEYLNRLSSALYAMARFANYQYGCIEKKPNYQ
jgi:deoxyhypusine synthase